MKKTIIFLSMILVFVSLASNKEVFGQNCSKYFGKGYCVDYIKQKVGKKQGGDAGTWSSNIDAKSVRAGDVAIFSSPTPYGHVAMVERVIYERNTDKPYQIEISEWNWGPKMIDQQCAVTDMFGKMSRRTVRVTNVKGFWRP